MSDRLFVCMCKEQYSYKEHASAQSRFDSAFKVPKMSRKQRRRGWSVWPKQQLMAELYLLSQFPSLAYIGLGLGLVGCSLLEFRMKDVKPPIHRVG
jgi:hypothetical protein